MKTYKLRAGQDIGLQTGKKIVAVRHQGNIVEVDVVDVAPAQLTTNPNEELAG